MLKIVLKISIKVENDMACLCLNAQFYFNKYFRASILEVFNPGNISVLNDKWYYRDVSSDCYLVKKKTLMVYAYLSLVDKLLPNVIQFK